MPLTRAVKRHQLGLASLILTALAPTFSHRAAVAERTTLHRVNQVRRGALNRHQRHLLRTVYTWDRTQQANGVRVAGVLIQVLGLRDFHRFTRVHHQNIVRHTGNDTQVVGNHNGCCARFVLRLIYHLKHLRLNGHIQCSGGLIGDQNTRVIRNSHCNHNALAHTARKLVRVRTQTICRGRNTHQTHQLDRAIFNRLLAHALIVDL